MLRRANRFKVMSSGAARAGAHRTWRGAALFLASGAIITGLTGCATAPDAPAEAPARFSSQDLMNGTRISETACKAMGNGAVWAQPAPGTTACIRYWGAGLSQSTKRVIVFLHGDLIPPSASYLQSTPEAIQQSAQMWSQRLRAPYIHVGRPGTHGSSGNHRRRRTQEEAVLLSSALSELARRYGIREFVLAGQSGGGHMTSSLITLRDDIVCAIPTSAPSSPRIRFTMMGRTRDTTNFESYEPTEHLASNPMHPGLRVFILGDPDDSNVFWASQIILSEPLKARGVEHRIVEGTALGKTRHGLNDSARILAGLCFHDAQTETIRRHLRTNGIRE